MDYYISNKKCCNFCQKLMKQKIAHLTDYIETLFLQMYSVDHYALPFAVLQRFNDQNTAIECNIRIGRIRNWFSY